ncbi:hypothetical protein [Streptomyces flavochromogenes]|uniref:hypothetical protein n=1 Tax=Streptomyces flavochromogenes TaxID=68199 RepID=UPI000A973006|nr:hypothetical protein [Streptomyces flavochromogenes]
MSDEIWEYENEGAGGDEREEDEHAVAERIDTAHADNPRLSAWLDEQREGFADWSRRHGGGWDFGERSLDRVEALIREHVTSVDDLFAREHTPLVQVACWYVGEVHNRTRGTRWRLDPDPADSHPWSRRPYVIVPFARLDEYRDPEGIDYDARPQHHPLSSFLTLLREGPTSGPASLRAELDDYEPGAGSGDDEE